MDVAMMMESKLISIALVLSLEARHEETFQGFYILASFVVLYFSFIGYIPGHSADTLQRSEHRKEWVTINNP